MSRNSSWLEAIKSIGIKGVEALDPSLVRELEKELENERKLRVVETLNKIRLVRESQKQATHNRKEAQKKQEDAAESLRSQNESTRSIKAEEWQKRLKEHDTKRAEERKRLLDLMRSEEEKRQRNTRAIPLADLLADARTQTQSKANSARAPKQSPSLEAIHEYLTRRSESGLFKRHQPNPATTLYTQRMNRSTYAYNTRLAALIYNVKP